MITRDIAPDAVADLALDPPRAALASVVDDEIFLLPVEVTLDTPSDPAESTRVVRVRDCAPDLGGHNVVVVADDGPQWFRLRSLTVRGTAAAVGDNTYRVAPRRVVAWDYGSLREVSSPGSAKPQSAHSRRVPSDLPPLRSAKLEAALGNSHVMIVATRSRKGTPFAVPLWFIVHDDRIYAATAASSWTVRNAIDCPQVCMLFGGERGQGGDRLLVRGHAQAITEFPPATVLARTAWRYYLRP
ncbi:MAG: pyridoxamine 5'-phosphate oxidase family protein, partial [Mycobacterium sp.]